jgi:hypothetical protein
LIIKILITQLLPPFSYFYFLTYFLLGSNILLHPLSSNTPN